MAGNENSESFRVRRAKVDSLVLYEVTDQELETLVKGGDAGILLNFAFAAISVFVSFVVTLATVTMSGSLYYIFLIVTVGSICTGLVLVLVWWVSYKSVRDVARQIRARMKEENAEDVSDDPEAVKRLPDTDKA